MANEHGSSKQMPKSSYHNPNKNPSKRRKTENSDSAKVKIQYKRKSSRKTSYINVESGVDHDKQPKWCHQCLRKLYSVVQCNRCRSKAFCFGCMTKWYPNASEEEFVEACPVCRSNCNCKSCLRGLAPKVVQGYSCSKADKIHYSKSILRKVFPHVRCLIEEQLMEKHLEAKIKGLSLSDLQLHDAESEVDDEICCNNCGAYLFDLFRSCTCGYSLCLRCCQDLRDGGCLQGGEGMTCGWISRINGSIPCPPKDIGGCDVGNLELKQILAVDWVANTFKKAQIIHKTNTTDDIQQTSQQCCICTNPSNEGIDDNGKLEKEATQEKSKSSYFYSLSAKEIQSQDMNHFQLHWSKGEPIIVHDVLSTSSGLSWEPMVLWRSFRFHVHEVNAVSCLDWTEVTIDLKKFFNGYLEGGFKRRGRLMILKLEDWQPSQEEWSSHFLELISCLPFKDYTHPHNGYLNVAIKLPDQSVKSDMGPRMDIAYGGSVTMLHYKKSDAVNVLTHTKSTKLGKTKMVEKEHGDQDEALVECALWDIFRRQDIPKLEKYLMNHSAELLHVEQVLHPIHDRIFYLNLKDLRKLKEEFDVEPWTFEQKLGDAVFIPAGCPCQVRNFKSCTKVELNFVSPESLEECIRLQNELRMLPNNHRAKRDKLNIGKMMLHALDHAVADLAGIGDSDGPVSDLQFAKGPVILDGDDVNHNNGWLSYTQGDNDSQLETGSVFPDVSPSRRRNGSPIIEVNHEVDQEPAALEDSGLWRGHAVGLEAEKLLRAVEQSYPNTFQGVQIRSKTICLSILKEFHVVIKGFLETSVDEVTEESITSLHEDLKDFERFGFDLSWARKRLDMVEKLKFGNDPLRQELMVLEESLEPLKERLVERRKQYVKASEMLEKARLEYNNTKDARNNKAREMAQKFGSEYDRVLTGRVGFGMLPGY